MKSRPPVRGSSRRKKPTRIPQGDGIAKRRPATYNRIIYQDEGKELLVKGVARKRTSTREHRESNTTQLKERRVLLLLKNAPAVHLAFSLESFESKSYFGATEKEGARGGLEEYVAVLILKSPLPFLYGGVCLCAGRKANPKTKGKLLRK